MKKGFLFYWSLSDSKAYWTNKRNSLIQFLFGILYNLNKRVFENRAGIYWLLSNHTVKLSLLFWIFLKKAELNPGRILFLKKEKLAKIDEIKLIPKRKIWAHKFL